MIAKMLEGSSWIVGSIAVRAGRLGLKPRRSSLKPPAYDLKLKSLDGVTIAATYWPGRRADGPAILIAHGLASSRLNVQPNAEWLFARGYGVLTIDLRGHGGSGAALCGFGWPESQDVHAAFAWLKRKQSGGPILAIGISMGGAALLLGSRGPVAAEAIVLQAVFADIDRAIHSRVALVGGQRFADRYGPLLAAQARPRIGVAATRLSPMAVVRDLACPLLVIGGERDVFTPPDETRALFDAAAAPKSLWMMPDLSHNGASDTVDATYRARILAFARNTIGDPEG